MNSLKEIEQRILRELREKQSTQSFSGAFKVSTNRVVVSEKDGRRALFNVKKLNAVTAK